jgi:hypothetical protein
MKMTEVEKNERIRDVEEQMAKLQKELEDIRNTKISEWDFSAWDNYPTLLMREYAGRIPDESKFIKQFMNKLTLLMKLTRFKYCYDRDYVPDWLNADELKWYVLLHTTAKEYKVDWTVTWDRLSTVYFSSEEIAQRCADWLNAGCPEE